MQSGRALREDARLEVVRNNMGSREHRRDPDCLRQKLADGNLRTDGTFPTTPRPFSGARGEGALLQG